MDEWLPDRLTGTDLAAGGRTRRALDLAKAVVHEARTEKITFLAGSLAYHAFLSMLPLLVLVFVVVTTLGGAGLQEGFLTIVRAVLSPGATRIEVTDLFVSELRQAARSTGLSVVGIAVLLWGTLRIFRGLDTAFSDVYETEAANTVVDQVVDGVVVMVAFAVALVVAGALQQLVPATAAGPWWWLAGRALLVAGLAITLYPVYYVFPDTEVTRLEVVPGTLFTAGCLTAFQSLFQVYLAVSGKSPRSSIITGVLVLLTWLYFSGLVVLLGAVVNAVCSNRSADVRVPPVLGGVPIEEDPTATSTEAVVVDTLTQLAERLPEADSVAVTVDDERVALPPPRAVETDTEADLLEFGDTGLGLHLRWSGDGDPPAASTDAGEEPGVDSSDADGDAERTGQSSGKPGGSNG